MTKPLTPEELTRLELRYGDWRGPGDTERTILQLIATIRALQQERDRLSYLVHCDNTLAYNAGKEDGEEAGRLAGLEDAAVLVENFEAPRSRHENVRLSHVRDLAVDIRARGKGSAA